MALHFIQVYGESMIDGCKANSLSLSLSLSLNTLNWGAGKLTLGLMAFWGMDPASIQPRQCVRAWSAHTDQIIQERNS